MPLSGLAVCVADADALRSAEDLYETALRDPHAGPFLVARYGEWGSWYPADPQSGGLILAHHDGGPAGFLAWRQDETIATIGPVIVASTLRRFGVGGALLSEAVTVLRKTGHRLLEAEYQIGDTASARLFTRERFGEVSVASDADAKGAVRVERLFQRRDRT